MDNNQNAIKKFDKRPWYLQSCFIAILFAFWFIYVPPAIGVILLIVQAVHDKKIKEQYKMIEDANAYKATLESECSAVRQQTETLKSEQQATRMNMQNEKQSLLQELDWLNRELTVAYTTTPIVEETITSEEYKSQYSMITLKEKEMIKNNKAITITNYTMSKKETSSNIKQLLRCFNAESDVQISSVTFKNIESVKNKIQKSFETLNKLFVLSGVQVNQEFFRIKLEEADLMYKIAYQKEQERLQQKAIREQMVEEEKVRREIEKEKAKVEKEETHFKQEIDNLMKRLHAASEIEKQLYVDKIRELEEKLKEVEESKKNVLEREQNTRAGYVYIISNIGSFGENVYKIGMTRRLDPMDRINELSSASVPFEFDVHAMIFSDDAPALEATLHNAFSDRRVNMINKRKEFFRVSLLEIEKVVKQNFNATVQFTMTAEAAQYRETQKMMHISETPVSVPESPVQSSAFNTVTVNSISETIQKIGQNQIPDFRCQTEDTPDFYKLHIHTTGSRKLGVVKISKSDLSIQFRELGNGAPIVHELQSAEDFRALAEGVFV